MSRVLYLSAALCCVAAPTAVAGVHLDVAVRTGKVDVTITGRGDSWPVDMRSRKAHRASKKSVSGRGPGAESFGQR